MNIYLLIIGLSCLIFAFSNRTVSARFSSIKDYRMAYISVIVQIGMWSNGFGLVINELVKLLH